MPLFAGTMPFGWIIRKQQKYIDKILKSSTEPQSQFQPNLEQSILGYRVFKFVQMKGPTHFQG